MVRQKYDISKTFKLSNQNIISLVEIQKKKGFSSDSEVVRFALNLTATLLNKELESKVLADILEVTSTQG